MPTRPRLPLPPRPRDRGSALPAAGIALSLVLLGAPAGADEGNPYDDPPPQRATHGIADCPPPAIRRLSPEDARREAHQRVERGTSCWLAGQCPPGGDYKDDAGVNAQVVAAIAADPRFADTSVWVETLRKFVTLKGCVVDAAQGARLVEAVRSVPGVKLVFQETRVTARRR